MHSPRSMVVRMSTISEFPLVISVIRGSSVPRHPQPRFEFHAILKATTDYTNYTDTKQFLH